MMGSRFEHLRRDERGMSFVWVGMGFMTFFAASTLAIDPNNPHVVYIGAPIGRSGIDGASVDHATIRQVWVSGNPRPVFPGDTP